MDGHSARRGRRTPAVRRLEMVEIVPGMIKETELSKMSADFRSIFF